MMYNINLLIDKMYESTDVLVQIGANDGIQDDLCRSSIIKTKINSHLIEPVPYIYNKLCQNYANYDNVQLYNFAIGKSNNNLDFFYVYPTDDLPIWTQGLGTFDQSKNFLGSGLAGLHLAEDLSNSDLYKTTKQRIRTEQIKTLTLDKFLETYLIKQIDFYISDTEGYDGIIFDQLNLKKYYPKIICMETHTLDTSSIEKINNKLSKFKYKILHQKWDTIAIRNDYASSY